MNGLAMVYQGMGDNSKKIVDSAFGFPANPDFISIFKEVCNSMLVVLLYFDIAFKVITHFLVKGLKRRIVEADNFQTKSRIYIYTFIISKYSNTTFINL